MNLRKMHLKECAAELVGGAIITGTISRVLGLSEVKGDPKIMSSSCHNLLSIPSRDLIVCLKTVKTLSSGPLYPKV